MSSQNYKEIYRAVNSPILDAFREYDRNYQRLKRQKYPEAKAEENRLWRLKNKEKIKAHSTLTYALKKGKIIREPCEVCNEEKSHAHHTNYSEPLNVKWLCSIHHKLEHVKVVKEKPKETINKAR